MNNSFKENREKSNSEKLAEAKRDRDSSLAIAIATGVAIAGSLVVGNTPAITNEVLQEASELVQHFMPLIGGIGLANVGFYLKFKHDAQKLESQEQTEDNEEEMTR